MELPPVAELRIHKNDGTTLPYEFFADEPVTIGFVHFVWNFHKH